MNKTRNKENVKHRQIGRIKDVAILSVSSLMFCTGLFLLLSFIYVKLVDNTSFIDFIHLSVCIWIIILIPYSAIAILSVFHAVYDFYLLIFISLIISLSSIIYAWLFLFAFLPFGFVFISCLISFIYLIFWYFLNFKKCGKLVAIEKSIKLKIIDVGANTVDLKSFRVKIYERYSSSNKSNKGIVKYIEYIISSSLAFPIGFSIVIMIGKLGFNNIQMVIVALLLLVIGFFFLTRVILMHELPAVLSLRKVEKANKARFKSI